VVGYMLVWTGFICLRIGTSGGLYGGLDWIHLSKDRDQWWALVMKLRFP
jgi:hypothetical protein